MLQLQDIEITYPGLAAPVLRIPNLSIGSGERVAVTGASGSGKSTLVNVITGLERVRKGHVLWDRVDLAGLSEGARDRWRADTIGLVLQDFHLFPGLSAIDNVLLPARLSRAATSDVVERASTLLTEVGLSRPDQPIETMSRGEMQRVAIARALVRRPKIIIADEPNASLDAENGAAVGDLLLALSGSIGATLVVVTHETGLMARLDRRLTLAGGRIVADERIEGLAA